jgi:hypothetical protein
MLVFSLVREMYRKHSLPVFMTSGNHEAYQVPYGISARVEAGAMDNWAFKLGVLEAATKGSNVDDLLGKGASASVQAGVQALGGPLFGRWLNRSVKGAVKSRASAEVAEHKKDLEAASAWTRGKANEGMSRDHNMTIYEACLAYGPTYGQALTGFNFNGGQFDWFYALFTPLADVTVAYGAHSDDKHGKGTLQTLAALGWGTSENFKNITDLDSKDGGVDRQGAGILPRAVESFSDDQLALLKQAAAYKEASKSTLTVASHFTIVSFDEPEPFSNVDKAEDRCSFVPHNGATGVGLKAAFNQVNVGTCERNQAVYLEHYVNVPGRRGKGPGADWHLAGHSHRSGVYKVRWQQDNARAVATRRVQIYSAKDPGIHEVQTVPPDTETALIVSSCGGPIGYQNLDGELSAWTGRPPAGTLLDPVTGRISQVSTSRCRIEDGRAYNEKPRLCVALDYLHVMSGLPEKGNIVKPLEFGDISRFATGNTQIPLRLSRQMKTLNCIVSLTLWVFEGGKDAAGDDVRKWHRVGTKLDKLGSPSSATISNEGMAALSRAFATGVVGKQTDSAFRRIQATFCEVGLRKPEPMKADEDWAKDMQCTDPWVFPISVVSLNAGRTMSNLVRVGGEKGEVPDWKWLAQTFEDNGYIDPKIAIAGKASAAGKNKP